MRLMSKRLPGLAQSERCWPPDPTVLTFCYKPVLVPASAAVCVFWPERAFAVQGVDAASCLASHEGLGGFKQIASRYPSTIAGQAKIIHMQVVQ